MVIEGRGEADVSGLGAHTPRSSICMKNGSVLNIKLWKPHEQVTEWSNYL